MANNDYLIVSGSQNADSQSLKVARTVQTRLGRAASTAAAHVHDLATSPLPYLGAEFTDTEKESMDTLGPACENASGYVFVTPEWHGMVPAALKNFFLYFSRGQLAHKPALIVAVSASTGGAYPIAELRMSSYKNSRVCFLPEHLIVRNVRTVFNADGENEPESQAYLSDRLDFCLEMLTAYSEAFITLRGNLPDLATYENGM